MKGKLARPWDVAIVGMACRFPGARDLVAYWANVLRGVDATGDVPPARWDPAVFFDPGSSANDRVYCRRGGYLEEPITFNAAAHGVAPSAVDGAEPEQFLILDTARAALADAGLAQGVTDGRRVEVVVGRGNYFNRGNLTRLQHGRIVAQTVAILRTLHPDWPDEHFEAVRAELKAGLPPFGPATIPGQLTNGTAGLTANRLGLSGASYVVDAASASALVALDLGARALADRRADLSLVGAVFLAADVDFPMVFCRLGALSRGGTARPFGRDADGTLPGEGVGVVVLKRLADAERDGDRVYAVLKGTGIASDGRGRGLASPSARGHARALRRAYRQAGVDPSTVGLIEGHGLGVPAADRAELRALRAVFPRPERGRRALGAVSSMIGHAMPAAGMAGLIKTALALHHRVLPPTLHADEPHPLLRDEANPFALNAAARPWVHGESGSPRRAGVNAFGFAGVNAHAILEEHAASADGLGPGCQLDWETEAVLLGAPDRATWLELARALAAWLDRGSNLGVPLKDLAYTLNVGQPRFAFRVGLVARSTEDLRERLAAAIDRLAKPECRSIRDARGTYFGEEPLGMPGRVAFLYAGEGSQYPGMLAELCLHFPEVRTLFDTADRVAIEQGHARLPSEELFAGQGRQDDGLWTMGTAINVVLSAHWALHQLLGRLGVRPDAVLGHSSGEFLALGAAGAYDVDRRFEDGLGRLGTLFEGLERDGVVPAATLIAVAADRGRVEAACRESGLSLRVAMDNCPHQVVLSGTPEDAEALARLLRGRGVLCETLPFARAYHTEAFASALGPVRSFFDERAIRTPSIPVYSCATGGRMGDHPDDIRRLAVEQWVRPVAFRSTIEAMHADGVRVFVEVGTRGSLTGFVEDILRGRPHFAVAANLPRRSGITQLNHLLASLFAQGVAVRPDLLYARRRPAHVDLDRDLPSRREGQTLAVGFPELRLSSELTARLASYGRPPEATPRTARPEAASVPALPELLGERTSPSGPRDEAMLEFLRTMDDFLETQRSVMAAYLAAPGPAGPTHVEGWDDGSPMHGERGTDEPFETDDPLGMSNESRRFVYEELAGVGARPTNGNGVRNGDADHHAHRPQAASATTAVEEPAISLERALLEQVSGRTGYPLEMLGLDLDVEGDLGIDSIKRVEILGDLQARGFIPPGTDLDRLSRCKTLREVIAVIEPPARAAPAVGPWVGTVRSFEPGRSLVATRRLAAAGDPVAEHHTLGGRRISALHPDRLGLPVVPFTVMAEMLAQAASALVPDGALVALRDVQAHRWMRYDEEALLTIRASRGPGDRTEVRVSVYQEGAEGAPRPAAESPIVEGVVVFGERRPEPPAAPPFTLADPRRCRFTAEELYDDQWLFHGRAFRALTQVGASSPSGIEGTLRVLPRGALFRDPGDAGSLRTDPIVLDAFTHLLGCWGLDEFPDGQGDVIFPLRVGEIAVFGEDPPEGTELACRIAIREATRHRIRVGAELVAPEGRVWIRISDWDDWRFYWPARFRDQFRAPDRVFVGEPLELPGVPSGSAQAVWLEPPPDMAKPVWGDVMEWVQLGPDERAACRSRPGQEPVRTLRVWGKIAAKEAARRLWLDAGRAPVYPSDLVIENDEAGAPTIRSLHEPGRVDGPAISIAHTEGVAVALAALDPSARVGIDVEAIVARDEAFEAFAFTEAERGWLDRAAGRGPARPEWVARLWCAKEAVGKATGRGLPRGPSSVVVRDADIETGEVRLTLDRDLAEACPEWASRAIRAVTARRGERVWAWTLGELADDP